MLTLSSCFAATDFAAAAVEEAGGMCAFRLRATPPACHAPLRHAAAACLRDVAYSAMPARPAQRAVRFEFYIHTGGYDHRLSMATCLPCREML